MNMAVDDYGQFAPQQPGFGYQPLSQSFGNWGGGASIGGIDLSAIADPAMRAQLQIQQEGLGYQKQLAANSVPVAPSKWATAGQTFGSVAQGLAGLGSIYLGLQGMKQQKKAFEFNKGVTNTNLNNSISDYNRRLNDTLTNRSLNNGGGQGYISEQLAKYSAKRS